MYFPPKNKALAQETEAHRRLRLLAEGKDVAKQAQLQRAERMLARTKAKFAKLQEDMKVI